LLKKIKIQQVFFQEIIQNINQMNSIAMLNKLALMLVFFSLSVSNFAQNTITGVVKGNDGESVIGVNILEKGSLNGTVTDIDGNYSINVGDDATLIFSFIGYSIIEETVNGRSTIDVTLSDDVQVLEEVFISATSKPIRRIEGTTAIELISAKEIERMNPTGIADLVRYVPGIFVQNKSGRTRNFIFFRGFPDGGTNGLVYSSLMIDGIKTFGSSEMAPDAGFRNDLNVGSVEVIKGSAGTLYGRGAASGAINVISKTGAATTNGKVKLTAGNNNWFQLDANINGALSKDKTWRYNLGGFWLTDDGYRNAPFGDKGGQIRFNIDKLFDDNKGSFRITGGLIDFEVNNYLDIPYEINDLTKPAGDWENTDVVLQDGNPFEGKSWPFTYGTEVASNEYDEWYPKGNFSKGFNLGAAIDYDLGNGIKLSNKLRYQDLNNGVTFDFPINNVGGSGNSSVATFGDTQTRVVVGGGRTGGGNATTDLIDELRLTKLIEGTNSTHTLSIGAYMSLFEIKTSADAAIFSVNTTSPEQARTTVFGIPSGTDNEFFAISFRNSEAKENTFSVFAGDEMKFGDQFSLVVGARYDAIKLDLINNPGISATEINRSIDHSGLSASIGFNYLMTPLTAIYGNIARTYRAPDYGNYIPFAKRDDGTFTKPKITENENITSFEFGYRKSTKDWSFDGGIFWTDIVNRRVAAFINAVATQVPAGDNHIRGAEMSFIYTPQSVKGLFIRTSITAQTTNLTDFSQTISYINPANDTLSISETIDFDGNELPDVPPFMWNLSVGYSNDNFGFNVNNNYISERWADPYNTLKYPSRSLVTANLYVNVSKGLRVTLAATNLLNNSKISSAVSVRNAANPTLFVADKFGNTGNYRHTFGIPLLPRRLFASVQYSF